MRLDVHSLVTEVLSCRRDGSRGMEKRVDDCVQEIARARIVDSDRPATGHVPLRALTADVLRHALRDVDCRGADDDVLVAGLRRTCAAARDRGMRVEGLIILFKDAWHELPEARLVPRHEGADVLSAVISLCIEEYFRGTRPE